jgi:Photosynthetic reaction centre cytochrome C subunit
MPRRAAVSFAVTLLVLVSMPLTGQTTPPTQPPAQAHRPMPKPTNLQVLPKDIAPADLIATMRGFNKALGVECTFCHAEDPQTHRTNFALDTKEDKGMARIMIAMTQEINAKYLSQIHDPDAMPEQKTVVCSTCHRGNTMPMPFNAPAGGEMHHDHPADGTAAPPKPE